MTQETPIHGETSADHSDGTSAETTSIQYREKNRLRKKKSLIRRYQYLLKLKRLGKIETQLGVIYKQLEEEKPGEAPDPNAEP